MKKNGKSGSARPAKIQSKDPYFVHYYRVNFDGTGLVALTEGNGTHTIDLSPDRQYLIDTWSRVDLPPVNELRRASDGKLVCKLEEADMTELKATWQAPEVFVAKGRDGKTDIWGIICRPRDFDPAKKYPVIEQIYAGPQGSFVPKSFSSSRRFSSLTDLGFIVVQMDGMGTANRSKAFHDVCWKNLKDAGFPDRILWHKAAAAKYPYYDISRVGVYGHSAGGQNAAGAVLFHPDFYKVAVASCGCHDNRMDKASWNEQWMGYPVGATLLRMLEHRQRPPVARQTAVDGRRVGQQRASRVDAAFRGRAHQGQQGFRPGCPPRPRPRHRHVRRTASPGLLCSPSARRRTAQPKCRRRTDG
jgi:dipeptidyl aminopeptidase/acylaminoacyl peptidase